MEVKTEGLVLRATDYKENDKLLTLFSPTLGKITAGARGVKKPTAKLNFAAQPFAFFLQRHLITRLGFIDAIGICTLGRI